MQLLIGKKIMKKIILILKGMLMGFASIAIPGVSASTIGIILCVYYQMIDAISSLLKDFKKSIGFLFFLVLGFAIGSLVGANLVSIIYDKYPLPIILVILGFIVGSLPRMIINLKGEFKKPSNLLVMLLVFIFVLGLSFLVTRGEEVQLSINMGPLNYILLIIVGLITAGTLVIPGMDFAVILLALGYYTAFVDLLNFHNAENILGNLVVLAVFFISYGIGTFFLSKLIKRLINNHEKKVQMAILSFVLISPVVIIKQCIFENSYFRQSPLVIPTSQIIIGIILFLVAMITVIVLYELTNPNDKRIEAMKKRNMFRFYFTIAIQFPVALYYLIKMQKIVKKDLLTFEERYALCMKLVRKVNKGGNIHPKVYGKEYLTKDPTLYIVNHQGRYDGCCFFNAVEDYPCTMVVDKGRIVHHFYIETFAMLKGEAIDKTDIRSQVKVMKNVAERLKNGESFVLFIEGKYGNNRNTLQEFHTGVLQPAYKSGCKVTPIVLYDSWKVFSISSLRRIEPETHVLPPIEYDEYKDLSKAEFSDLLKTRMQAKIDEIDERKAQEALNKKAKKHLKNN